MAKAPTHTALELEVLEDPDFFRVGVFQDNRWVYTERPYTASEIMDQYNILKKLGFQRTMLHAVRVINNQECVATITPAYLSALIELGNH